MKGEVDLGDERMLSKGDWESGGTRKKLLEISYVGRSTAY